MMEFIPWYGTDLCYIVGLDAIIVGAGNTLEEALSDAYHTHGIKREEVAI